MNKEWNVFFRSLDAIHQMLCVISRMEYLGKIFITCLMLLPWSCFKWLFLHVTSLRLFWHLSIWLIAFLPSFKEESWVNSWRRALFCLLFFGCVCFIHIFMANKFASRFVKSVFIRYSKMQKGTDATTLLLEKLMWVMSLCLRRHPIF